MSGLLRRWFVRLFAGVDERAEVVVLRGPGGDVLAVIGVEECRVRSAKIMIEAPECVVFERHARFGAASHAAKVDRVDRMPDPTPAPPNKYIAGVAL